MDGLGATGLDRPVGMQGVLCSIVDLVVIVRLFYEGEGLMLDQPEKVSNRAVLQGVEGAIGGRQLP